MTGLNYNRFKADLKKVQEERHAILLKDISVVRAFVEKMLTLFLESTTNMSRVNYPGLGALE